MSLKVFHLVFVAAATLTAFAVSVLALSREDDPWWALACLGLAGGVGLSVYGVKITKKFRESSERSA